MPATHVLRHGIEVVLHRLLLHLQTGLRCLFRTRPGRTLHRQLRCGDLVEELAVVRLRLAVRNLKSPELCAEGDGIIDRIATGLASKSEQAANVASVCSASRRESTI